MEQGIYSNVIIVKKENKWFPNEQNWKNFSILSFKHTAQMINIKETF